MDLMVTTDRLGGLAMEDGDTMQNLAHNLILMVYNQKNKYLVSLHYLIFFSKNLFITSGRYFWTLFLDENLL